MKGPGRNDPCPCGSGRKFKVCHGKAGGTWTGDEQASALPSLPPAPTVQPGRLSPPRTVPPEIPRPEYAETGTPTRSTRRTLVKSAEELERMRVAGKAARKVLNAVLEAIKPGVTTDELDAIAHQVTVEQGAYPSTLNYHGYPKSMCTSVNEVICHGIPDSRALQTGDIVNCDVTLYLNGVHGDCSEMAFVGRPDAENRKLVDITWQCMMAGINAARHGGRLNAIGKAIQTLAHRNGYSVVRDFSGHGIGERFHMPPNVLHYFDRMARVKLEAGMTFTVEPMINVGRPESRVWTSDGWTAVTVDLKRSAQFEHTILITPRGTPELLTASEGKPFYQRQLERWDAEDAATAAAAP